MRIITWNVHWANEKSAVWEFISGLEADVLLLQEVVSIPKHIVEKYKVLSRTAIYKTGKPQRFSTAVMTKGEIVSEISLLSDYDWVNRELDFFKGNFIGCTVLLPNQGLFNIVSVYSPAWPVDKNRLTGIDVSQVKLKLNPDVWATEILWSGLKKAELKNTSWIIGGDFNSSETFDKEWQTKNGMTFGLQSSGNKEILDRMANLGLTECLRKFNNDTIIPTFKHSSGEIAHQMDHLFVTDRLMSQLNNCVAGDQTIVFDKLSDHLPIIADFNLVH
jgi:exonuclease III